MAPMLFDSTCMQLHLEPSRSLSQALQSSQCPFLFGHLHGQRRACILASRCPCVIWTAYGWHGLVRTVWRVLSVQHQGGSLFPNTSLSMPAFAASHRPHVVFLCPFLSGLMICRLCLVGRSRLSSPAALLQLSFAIKSGARLLHDHGTLGVGTHIRAGPADGQEAMTSCSGRHGASSTAEKQSKMTKELQ